MVIGVFEMSFGSVFWSLDKSFVEYSHGGFFVGDSYVYLLRLWKISDDSCGACGWVCFIGRCLSRVTKRFYWYDECRHVSVNN